MRSRSVPIALACAALVAAPLGGCGNSRTPPADVSIPAAPGGFIAEAYPGFTVSLPRSWRISPGNAPLVATAQSGLATIAVWRYPRTERLPRGRAALEAALRSLTSAIRARDPSFQLLHAAITPIGAHHHGLELVGIEMVDGAAREVRSTHMFVAGTEVVVDEFAPQVLFARTDQLVFLPVAQSLRVGHPA